MNKIILSKHVINDKLPTLENQGWHITEKMIKETVATPKWQGISINQLKTAMNPVNRKHIPSHLSGRKWYNICNNRSYFKKRSI